MGRMPEAVHQKQKRRRRPSLFRFHAKALSQRRAAFLRGVGADAGIRPYEIAIYAPLRHMPAGGVLGVHAVLSQRLHDRGNDLIHRGGRLLRLRVVQL